MFDTRDQILNQLRAGEDGRAEFKDVRLGKRGVAAPNAEELASELVAFANAEGGVVFLGVDDAGGVRGIAVERLDMVENWIVNLATNNCDPPILQDGEAHSGRRPAYALFGDELRLTMWAKGAEAD